MKKAIAVMITVLLLLPGCNSDIPAPAECVLCHTYSRHAPCLVDLNSGEIRDLEIYQLDYAGDDQLSDTQYGGYLSLISLGEINGILLGAESVELEVPSKASGMVESIFCNNCRQMLKDSKCQGYVLADLHAPKNPTVWSIKDGISFSVRCYDVTITKSDKPGKLKIVMNGTLEIKNLIIGD